MKKKNRIQRYIVLSLLLLLVTFLSSCGTTIKKENIEIVDDNLSDEEYVLLRETENYVFPDEELQQFTLNDQPIMRYEWLFFDEMEQPLKDINYGKNYVYKQYIVFDKKPIRLAVSVSGEGKRQISIRYMKTSIPYLRDLLNVSPKMKIMGNTCTVEDVFLAITTEHFPSTILYYDTDQGVFVRFYKDDSAEGEWFTEQAFTNYAHQYNEYLRETSHDENGVPLDGEFPFWAYLDLIRSEEIP